jgi:hypothetical protein
MLKLADITVYSPDHQLQLVVEVKGKSGATGEWAAQMRRNLLAHSVVPRSPFFILALPDRLYLWKNGAESAQSRPADFVVDSTPIVAPYLGDTEIAAEQLSGRDLELIIKSWLSQLTISKISEGVVAPHEKWLLESGLYQAIKDGSVETEASS